MSCGALPIQTLLALPRGPEGSPVRPITPADLLTRLAAVTGRLAAHFADEARSLKLDRCWKGGRSTIFSYYSRSDERGSPPAARAILEAIEDHMDVTESEKIMARVRAGSEQVISLEKVKPKYRDDAKPVKKAARPRKGKR